MRISVFKLLDDIVNDYVDSHQYFKYVSSSLLIHKGECKAILSVRDRVEQVQLESSFHLVKRKTSFCFRKTNVI